MQASPFRYTVFDLETTGTNLDQDEIVEIAAISPDGTQEFYALVETSNPHPEYVWQDVERRSNIDLEAYRKQRKPLRKVMELFLDFIGDSALAGHNIERFDVPMLEAHLERVGLTLPETARNGIDTLRWAHLVFPTLPSGLNSYRLGDLYTFLTKLTPDDAHQALADCRYTREVMNGLTAQSVPQDVLKVWKWLGLPEAGFYDAPVPTRREVAELLKVQACVPWTDQSGPDFPSVADVQLQPDLLGGRRETQIQMMETVAQNLKNGTRLLL